MELIQWLTLAVFAVTILTVVVNKLGGGLGLPVPIVESGSADAGGGRSPDRVSLWQ